MRYHTKLKNEIKALNAQTRALRKIRIEMEKELDGELDFQIDMNIELEEETKNWSK